MTHRDMLVENLDQIAAAKRDYQAAADAVRSHVLRLGPLQMDGNPNEQLQSQLRGLLAIFSEMDLHTHRAIETMDQITGMAQRFANAGVLLPLVPEGLAMPRLPKEAP